MTDPPRSGVSRKSGDSARERHVIVVAVRVRKIKSPLSKNAFVFALLLITLEPVYPVRPLARARLMQDAASGQNLPLATIQIQGTYRGTIANKAGEFGLELSELPATLHITFRQQFRPLACAPRN